MAEPQEERRNPPGKRDPLGLPASHTREGAAGQAGSEATESRVPLGARGSDYAHGCRDGWGRSSVKRGWGERATSAPTRACPACATLSRTHLVWQTSQALISRNGKLSIVHEVPPLGGARVALRRRCRRGVPRRLGRLLGGQEQLMMRAHKRIILLGERPKLRLGLTQVRL